MGLNVNDRHHLEALGEVRRAASRQASRLPGLDTAGWTPLAGRSNAEEWPS